MKVRLLGYFALAASLLLKPAFGSPVKFDVALKDGKTEFRTGEPIVLELTFMTDEQHVTVNTTTTEPPSPVDTLEISPASGVYPWLEQQSGGHRYSPDYASLSELAPNQPITIPLVLNDLYRFDSAGHYTVRVTSKRVQVQPHEDAANRISVSNEISFDVVPFPEADQGVRASSLEQQIRAATDQPTAQALASELDYLPGDAAIPAKLSLYLNPKTFYPFGVDLTRGLWIARNRPMVVAALERALADPTQASGAGSGMLQTLIAMKISTESEENDSATAKQAITARITAQYVHLIAQSLPSRQGDALIDAARTVFVSLANSGNTGEPDFNIARELLITHFGEVNEYNVDWMLNTYGKYLKDPRITPALRHILETTNDPTFTGNRAAALLQIALIAPEDTPQYLVREACAEHPVMLHTVNFLIPDETLPSVDSCLKQKLLLETSAQAGDERRQLGETMEYIARFADNALVGDMRKAYRARTDDWDQAARGAAVTYLMRWDAERSLPLLEQLMPAHDPTGGAMLYFLLDAAHSPADGMRKAFRQCVLDEDPRSAGACAYALSRVGEPEDQRTIERRLEKLQRQKPEVLTPESVAMEGELVAALIKGSTWDTTEQEAAALKRSCVTKECQKRFETGH